MAYEGYCTIASIKPRLLITGASHDTALETAGTEASRIIDEKIRPYMSRKGTVEKKEPLTFVELPLTSTIIPDILKEICADLAAGLFKRRHRPQEFDQGWLNQAYTKVDEFIKNNWFRGTFGTSEEPVVLTGNEISIYREDDKTLELEVLQKDGVA